LLQALVLRRNFPGDSHVVTRESPGIHKAITWIWSKGIANPHFYSTYFTQEIAFFPKDGGLARKKFLAIIYDTKNSENRDSQDGYKAFHFDYLIEISIRKEN